MIKGFADKLTQDVFDGVNSRFSRKLPRNLVSKAQRLLDQIDAITKIETLRIPPSNKLAKLSGNLGGFWRIKIDKQWAIIFRWQSGDVCDVKIIDYH